MVNIESEYSNYIDIVARVGVDEIRSLYSQQYNEVLEFLERFDRTGEKLFVNERTLMHAVLEYFSDIEKVKSAHNLQHANSIKVKSYLYYWFLRRKPIQIQTIAPEDDDLVFINEKFVVSEVMSFLTLGSETKALVDEDIDIYEAFANTFYYYLKFRQVEPQSLEMIMLSFHLGGVFPECKMMA